jgi:hypothetical protein
LSTPTVLTEVSPSLTPFPSVVLRYHLKRAKGGETLSRAAPCGNLISLAWVREERECEIGRQTEGSVKKPKAGEPVPSQEGTRVSGGTLVKLSGEIDRFKPEPSYLLLNS